MLRIIKTGRGDAPCFVCDLCKERIEEIGLALYTWKQLETFRWDESGNPELVISPRHPSVLVEDGLIYTLHKGCVDKFEKEHGGDAFDWPWMELIDLIVFLIHNSGTNIEDIQEREGYRRQMDVP